MNTKIAIPKLNEGEFYAGILLGKYGTPNQHIILLSGQANDVTFQQAQEFAAKAGGDLPTRREQSLLFANLKKQFEEHYYWSSELRASDSSDYAWYQDFDNGYQDYYDKCDELRARAVRRVAID